MERKINIIRHQTDLLTFIAQTSFPPWIWSLECGLVTLSYKLLIFFFIAVDLPRGKGEISYEWIIKVWQQNFLFNLSLFRGFIAKWRIANKNKDHIMCDTISNLLHIYIYSICRLNVLKKVRQDNNR